MNSPDIPGWLVWLGFAPLAVVLLDMLQIARSVAVGRLRVAASWPAQPPQFWIQDFVILAAGYAAGVYVIGDGALGLMAAREYPSTFHEILLRSFVGALLGVILFQLWHRQLAQPLRAFARALALLLCMVLCHLFGFFALVAGFVAIRMGRGFCFQPEVRENAFGQKAALASFAVYAAAFFFTVRDGTHTLPGWGAYLFTLEVLLEKFYGDIEGLHLLTALFGANVAQWVALYALLNQRWLVALLAGALAVLGGLSTAFVSGFAHNFSPGYVLWVGSMAGAAMCGAIALLRVPGIATAAANPAGRIAPNHTP